MFNKNILRRFFVMILAVVLCFSSLAVGAYAADNTVGGTCGDNLIWSLDLDSGLLEISGKGKMVCSPLPFPEKPRFTKSKSNQRERMFG